MLSLGIPGSATAAVMMGGLMIWGLNPGPMLFIEQKDFVWGLIASMYLGNIVAVILVLLTVPMFAALMRIPFFIIAPLIVIVCAVGAYSVSNSYLDVLLMMGFGVVGYLFKKLSLSAGAARARHRHRRQGRGRLPPVDADVEGLARDILRKPAGDDPGRRRLCASAAAARPLDSARIARWSATPSQFRGDTDHMSTQTHHKPLIALAMGDPAGISPELTARLVASDEVRGRANLLVIGDRRVFDAGARIAGVSPDIKTVTDTPMRTPSTAQRLSISPISTPNTSSEVSRARPAAALRSAIIGTR